MPNKLVVFAVTAILVVTCWSVSSILVAAGGVILFGLPFYRGTTYFGLLFTTVVWIPLFAGASYLANWRLDNRR